MRVSIGTAGVLGLARVPMVSAPTTAYLMVGDRCVMNCAFCAQARESAGDGSTLSRVTWPAYGMREVIRALKRAEQRDVVQRVCLQVTAGQESYDEALRVIRRLHRSVFLPLSVAILPANISQVAELLEAGVDAIGFGLDAASEHVFRVFKGQHWEHMLQVIEQTGQRFPGVGSVHLIVGLGESEREMVERMMWVCDLGLRVGLFAFTPVRGTKMADLTQPPLGYYRRMQVARWLIVNHHARATHFTYLDNGTLTGIRMVGWQDRVSDGRAFHTAGCPACNRPFYNERPGGTIYNYAQPPAPEEAAQAVLDTGLDWDGRDE